MQPSVGLGRAPRVRAAHSAVMTKPMTTAQAAQQNNRNGDGRYATRVADESGVDLGAGASTDGFRVVLAERFAALCTERGIDPAAYPDAEQAWLDAVTEHGAIPENSSTELIYDSLELPPLGDAPRAAWIVDMNYDGHYDDCEYRSETLSDAQLSPRPGIMVLGNATLPLAGDYDYENMGPYRGYLIELEPRSKEFERAVALGNDPRPVSSLDRFRSLVSDGAAPWAALPTNPDMVAARDAARARAVELSETEEQLIRQHDIKIPSGHSPWGGVGVDRGSEHVNVEQHRDAAVNFLAAIETGDFDEAERIRGVISKERNGWSMGLDQPFDHYAFAEHARREAAVAERVELEAWKAANPNVPLSVAAGVEQQLSRLRPPSDEVVAKNARQRESVIAGTKAVLAATEEIMALRVERDEARKLARLDDTEMSFPGPVGEFVGPTQLWRLSPGRNPW